jgi:hypothetical protein
MTPKSFDIATAKTLVGDSRMRTIESKARADADAGSHDAPAKAGGSYWDAVISEMEYVVYAEAHAKRLQRIQRMQERQGTTS